MKYKEIVDIIKTTCLDNFFINEFSYGNISDINTPDDEEPVNYPYAFLNPINVTNDGITSTFNANLIIMTQTYDTLDEELEQQSNCINYLEQIIGHINKNLDNPQVEFLTPFSVTPFKERFSDNVVGATASIAIQYPSNITDCDTPYFREDCTVYETICINSSASGGVLEGTYRAWRTGILTGGASNNFLINCDGYQSMIYTGRTTGGDIAIIFKIYTDTGTSWAAAIVNSGTIDCDNTVNLTRTSFVMDNITCGDNLYPDVSDQELYMSNGVC